MKHQISGLKKKFNSKKQQNFRRKKRGSTWKNTIPIELSTDVLNRRNRWNIRRRRRILSSSQRCYAIPNKYRRPNPTTKTTKRRLQIKTTQRGDKNKIICDRERGDKNVTEKKNRTDLELQNYYEKKNVYE